MYAIVFDEDSLNNHSIILTIVLIKAQNSYFFKHFNNYSHFWSTFITIFIFLIFSTAKFLLFEDFFSHFNKINVELSL
jgi:hypothetical protein